MTFSIISLLLAFIIAFGRQTAVFGKVEKSLWFFSNYEKKRIWFSIMSVLFGILTFSFSETTYLIITFLVLAFMLLVLSFIFDFKYIFPEVKKVEKKLGITLNIDPSTEIIGVNINDVAVAYPMDVVIPRHIINDRVLEKNIVVSYCAICRSALVFNAELLGEPLYFKVSGIWRRNMIMIDSETKSLWQQATGECIYGKLKGKQLELLSGENTIWSAWVKKYPKSEYAFKCIEARKGYLSRQGMIKGLNFITPKMTPPGFTNLEGLPTRETVFGIDYNGVSRAYPLSEIENITPFTDNFIDKKLDLEFEKSGGYLTATEPETKKQIVVEKHWWLGWKEFHPETEIWKKST